MTHSSDGLVEMARAGARWCCLGRFLVRYVPRDLSLASCEAVAGIQLRHRAGRSPWTAIDPGLHCMRGRPIAVLSRNISTCCYAPGLTTSRSWCCVTTRPVSPVIMWHRCFDICSWLSPTAKANPAAAARPTTQAADTGVGGQEGTGIEVVCARRLRRPADRRPGVLRARPAACTPSMPSGGRARAIFGSVQ